MNYVNVWRLLIMCLANEIKMLEEKENDEQVEQILRSFSHKVELEIFNSVSKTGYKLIVTLQLTQPQK